MKCQLNKKYAIIEINNNKDEALIGYCSNKKEYIDKIQYRTKLNLDLVNEHELYDREFENGTYLIDKKNNHIKLVNRITLKLNRLLFFSTDPIHVETIKSWKLIYISLELMHAEKILKQ
jgi:hypothetical protein